MKSKIICTTAVIVFISACGRSLPKQDDSTGFAPAGSEKPAGKDDLPKPGPTGNTGPTGGSGGQNSNTQFSGTVAELRTNKNTKAGMTLTLPEVVVYGLSGNGKAAYVADEKGGPNSGIEVELCDRSTPPKCVAERPATVGGKFKVTGKYFKTDKGHASIGQATLTKLGSTGTVAVHEVDAADLAAGVGNGSLLGVRVSVRKGTGISITDAEPAGLRNENNKTETSCREQQKDCCKSGPLFDGFEVTANGSKFYVTTAYYSTATLTEGLNSSTWPCSTATRKLKNGDKLQVLQGSFDVNSFGKLSLIPTVNSDLQLEGETGPGGPTSSTGPTGPTNNPPVEAFKGTIAGLRQLPGATKDTLVTIDAAVVVGVDAVGGKAYFADPAGGAYSGIEVFTDKMSDEQRPKKLGETWKLEGKPSIPSNKETGKWRIGSAKITSLTTEQNVGSLPVAASKASNKTKENDDIRGVRVNVQANGQKIIVSDARPAKYEKTTALDEAACKATPADCCKKGVRFPVFEVTIGDQKLLVSNAYSKGAKSPAGAFELTNWPCDGNFDGANVLKTGQELQKLEGVFDMDAGNGVMIPTQLNDSALGAPPGPGPGPDPTPTGEYCSECKTSADCKGGKSCVAYLSPLIVGTFCSSACAQQSDCTSAYGENSACLAIELGNQVGFCGPSLIEAVCKAPK